MVKLEREIGQFDAGRFSDDWNGLQLHQLPLGLRYQRQGCLIVFSCCVILYFNRSYKHSHENFLCKPLNLVSPALPRVGCVDCHYSGLKPSMPSIARARTRPPPHRNLELAGRAVVCTANLPNILDSRRIRLQVHPCGRYRHNTVVFILAKVRDRLVESSWC